jgi:hypothetical protein
MLPRTSIKDSAVPEGTIPTGERQENSVCVLVGETRRRAGCGKSARPGSMSGEWKRSMVGYSGTGGRKGRPTRKATPKPPRHSSTLLLPRVPFVRREKASIFSRCNSCPATVVPAGSNRSGRGGNFTAEASDGKDR